MKARRAKVDTDIMKYKSISKFVCNLTRRDHHHNLDSITNNLHTNQKPFWNWIKRIRGGLPPIPDLHHQGAVKSYLCSLQCQSSTSISPQCSLEKILPDWRTYGTLSAQRNTLSVQFEEEVVYNALCRINPAKSLLKRFLFLTKRTLIH